MTEIKLPIFQIDQNKIQLQVDTDIYSTDIITDALYKFTDIYYIYQSIDEAKHNLITIIFESKESRTISNTVVKLFCNELIDQKVRYNINKRFGKIRDMIVEEAFKPVNKK